MKLLKLSILVSTALTSHKTIGSEPKQPPRGPVSRASFLSAASGFTTQPFAMQPKPIPTPIQVQLDKHSPITNTDFPALKMVQDDVLVVAESLPVEPLSSSPSFKASACGSPKEFVTVVKPTYESGEESDSDSSRRSRSPKHGKPSRRKTGSAKKNSAAAVFSSSEGDNENPTIYTGSLPDIRSTQSHYKPSPIDINWWFRQTLLKLEKDESVDPREIEKAAAEALRHRKKYDPKEIARFTKLVESKKISINPTYWGDLHQAGELNKAEKARSIIEFLSENIKTIQQIHDGMIASAKGYGRLNGSAKVSPRAEYGLGSKFNDSEVAAYQQAIAKIFKLAETDHSSAAAAGSTLEE